MTLLPERVQAEETKHGTQEMLRFKARTRRDRLFGLWLAKDYLHLNDEMAAQYADGLVHLDFAEGHRDVALLEKAHADLVACGRPLSRHILERHLQQLAKVAHDEVITK
jgi:hypothetical protein